MGFWRVRMLLCFLIYPVENANVCTWASRLVYIPSAVQLHTMVGLTLQQSDYSSVIFWLNTLPSPPKSTSPNVYDRELRQGKRRYDSFEMETSAADTPSPKKRRVEMDSVADARNAASLLDGHGVLRRRLTR